MKPTGATKYYQASEVAKELGHAPLPWSVIDFGRKDDSGYAAIHIEAHVPIGGGTGMTVAELFYYQAFQDEGLERSVIETNAQMIVTAVNERERLREALRAALRIVVDRAAGGRMLTTQAEAKEIARLCADALSQPATTSTSAGGG